MYNKVCKSPSEGSKLETCIVLETKPKSFICASDVNNKYGKDCDGAFTCSSYQIPNIISRDKNASILSLLESMLPQGSIKEDNISNVRQLTVGKSDPGLRSKNLVPLCLGNKNPCKECNLTNTMTVGVADDCEPCVRKKSFFRRMMCWSPKKCKNCRCLLEDENLEQCKDCSELVKSAESLKNLFDLDYAPCRARKDATPCTETLVDYLENVGVETVCSARTQQSSNKNKMMDSFPSSSSRVNFGLGAGCSDGNGKIIGNSVRKCVGSCSKTTPDKFLNTSSQCGVDECQDGRRLSTAFRSSKRDCNEVEETVQCASQPQTFPPSSQYQREKESQACLDCPNHRVLENSHSIASNTRSKACLRNYNAFGIHSNLSIKSNQSGYTNTDSEVAFKNRAKNCERNCEAFLENDDLANLNYGKIDIGTQYSVKFPGKCEGVSSIQVQKSEADLKNQKDASDPEMNICYYNKSFQTGKDTNQSDCCYENYARNKIEIRSEKSSGSLTVTIDASTSYDFHNDCRPGWSVKPCLRSHEEDVDNKRVNKANGNDRKRYSDLNCRINEDFECAKFNNQQKELLHPNGNSGNYSHRSMCDDRCSDGNYSNNTGRNARECYKEGFDRESMGPKNISIKNRDGQNNYYLLIDPTQNEFYPQNAARNISSMTSLNGKRSHCDTENCPTLVDSKQNGGGQNKYLFRTKIDDDVSSQRQFMQANTKQTKILNKGAKNGENILIERKISSHTGKSKDKFNQVLLNSSRRDSSEKGLKKFSKKSKGREFPNNANLDYNYFSLYKPAGNCSQFSNTFEHNQSFPEQRKFFVDDSNQYRGQNQQGRVQEIQCPSYIHKNSRPLQNSSYISGGSSHCHDTDRELANIKYFTPEDDSSDEQFELIEARCSDGAKIDTLIGNILRPRMNSCNEPYQEWRGQPIDNVYHRSGEWRGNVNTNVLDDHPVYRTRNREVNKCYDPQIYNTTQARKEPFGNVNIIKTIQKEYEFPNGRKVLRTEITTELDDSRRQMGYGNVYGFDPNRSKNRNERNRFEHENVYQVPSTSRNQPCYDVDPAVLSSLYGNLHDRRNLISMDMPRRQQVYSNQYDDNTSPTRNVINTLDVGAGKRKKIKSVQKPLKFT